MLESQKGATCTNPLVDTIKYPLLSTDFRRGCSQSQLQSNAFKTLLYFCSLLCLQQLSFQADLNYPFVQLFSSADNSLYFSCLQLYLQLWILYFGLFIGHHFCVCLAIPASWLKLTGETWYEHLIIFLGSLVLMTHSWNQLQRFYQDHLQQHCCISRFGQQRVFVSNTSRLKSLLLSSFYILPETAHCLW